MSDQLMQTMMFLDKVTTDDVDPAESFAHGIGQVLNQIECSRPEKVILTSLAAACLRPTMLYSATLARDVRQRELAATAVVGILRQVSEDVECDQLSRIMASSLARELGAVVKIVDALEAEPTHPLRFALDGLY